MSSDAAKLRNLLTDCCDELREWSAFASYARDDAAAAGNVETSTWMQSRTIRAGSCAAELNALRGDLAALLDIESASNRYVQAVEALYQRRTTKTAVDLRRLRPQLVVGPIAG